VAAGNSQMTVADPAFRTTNLQGWGQVLAINSKNGTPNGPQNPVGVGEILTLSLTGQGLVANPPSGGFAPSGPTPTNPLDLHIFINCYVAGNVQSVLAASETVHSQMCRRNSTSPREDGETPVDSVQTRSPLLSRDTESYVWLVR
jgi:uncharacterized protein (TIGR03437 family)